MDHYGSFQLEQYESKPDPETFRHHLCKGCLCVWSCCKNLKGNSGVFWGLPYRSLSNISNQCSTICLCESAFSVF